MTAPPLKPDPGQAASPAHTQGQTSQLVDHLFRHKAGQMVSTLTRLFGAEHLQLAEDVVQESLIQALRHWPYRGVPENPTAWLIQVAKHRALNVLRREANFRNKAVALAYEAAMEFSADKVLALDDPLGDDQLTMMFLCCHPVLTHEAQVALILKTVGGFGVSEIARAFVTPEAALAQRLVRAKRKLLDEQIAFVLPAAAELPNRVEAVLTALYLLFNEGYTAHQGEALVRSDLCDEAIRLCSLLASHPLTNRPDVHALLALMWLQASRLFTRVNAAGDLILLSEQDRTKWDRLAIQAGIHHLQQAGTGDQLTSYHLQAAIAACHAVAASYEATDWDRILFYYDALAQINPSPIIALNRVVAVAMVNGPRSGLAELEKIQALPSLQSYYLLPATFGELYERLGERDKAIVHYRAALSLTVNEAERRFLLRKLGRLDPAMAG